MTQRARGVVAGLAWAFVAVVSASCAPLGVPGAASLPGGDVITPVQARTAAEPLIVRLEKAQQSADAGTIRSLTASPLRDELIGALQDAAPTFKPPAHPEQFKASVSVAVPHQQKYPAAFTAVAKVTTQDFAPSVTFYEFRKASSGASWLIDRAVVIEPNTPVPQPALDAAGYAYTMSTELVGSQFGRTSNDIASGWVDDFNAVVNSGRPSTKVFAATYGTTGFAFTGYTLQRPATTQQVGISVLASRSGYSTGVAVGTADGGALVPFVVEVQITYSAPPNYIITQGPARTDYGGLVPPGQWTTITVVDTAEVLAYIPPHATSTKLVALGSQTRTVSASTT